MVPPSPHFSTTAAIIIIVIIIIIIIVVVVVVVVVVIIIITTEESVSDHTNHEISGISDYPCSNFIMYLSTSYTHHSRLSKKSELIP